jgi:hypothetical protein
VPHFGDRQLRRPHCIGFHAISRVDLFCDGVKQAKEWAQALVDDKPVELWDGSTRIARFEPWHVSHANRSAPTCVKRT